MNDRVEHREERALWQLNAELEERIAEGRAELERTSQELERRRADLETIVQHIPAGLMLADADTGMIELVNERAKAILGEGMQVAHSIAEYSGDEGYAASGQRLGPDDWPLARALRGETVAGERVWMRRGDAPELVLEFHAAPVRSTSGRVVAGVVLFQDVTESERRRRAASEFIANAAHELRTPIAAIASAVEVLEAGAKETRAERDHFLGHVAREVDRLVRLTRALLLLARTQSGIEPPRLEIIEVAPLLREIASGVRTDPAVRVLVRCAPDAAALANRDLLEQALSAVANNAARFTNQGRIVLSASRPRGRTLIKVSDTGRGMTDDELAHSGERFFRGRAASDGFGLGLSIAQQAIETIGGTLVVTSAPDQGTTVRISLPAARLVSL